MATLEIQPCYANLTACIDENTLIITGTAAAKQDGDIIFLKSITNALLDNINNADVTNLPLEITNINSQIIKTLLPFFITERLKTLTILTKRDISNFTNEFTKEELALIEKINPTIVHHLPLPPTTGTPTLSQNSTNPNDNENDIIQPAIRDNTITAQISSSSHL